MKAHLKMIGAGLMVVGGLLMFLAGLISLVNKAPLNVPLFLFGVILLALGPTFMVMGRRHKGDKA